MDSVIPTIAPANSSEDVATKVANTHWMVAVILGFMGFFFIILLFAVCFGFHRNRFNKKRREEETRLHNAEVGRAYVTVAPPRMYKTPDDQVANNVRFSPTAPTVSEARATDMEASYQELHANYKPRYLTLTNGGNTAEVNEELPASKGRKTTETFSPETLEALQALSLIHI